MGIVIIFIDTLANRKRDIAPEQKRPEANPTYAPPFISTITLSFSFPFPFPSLLGPQRQWDLYPVSESYTHSGLSVILLFIHQPPPILFPLTDAHPSKEAPHGDRKRREVET